MNDRDTLGRMFARQGGVGAGFDYLRIALAIAIFFAHIAAIADTRGIFPSLIDFFRSLFTDAPAVVPVAPHAAHAPGNLPDMGLSRAGLSRPIVLSHVPMFFALSGFLVVGSAFRVQQVRPFLALRALRILPALCVEVVLSALLIGLYVTTLPAKDYFTDRHFVTYFGNIFGFVQMTLPGVVFPDSGEKTAVNANLWTLPGEFYCYLILSVAMFSGLVFRKRLCTALFVITTVALLGANWFLGYNNATGVLATDLNVYYFFVGIMFFHWKDRIVRSWPLLIACIVFVYFTIEHPKGVYLAPIPLTYITIFIGLIDFPIVKWLRSGDYSYGVYLYGFPISQLMLVAFPQLKGHYLALLFPSLLVTIVFAFLSWHLIEKHFLKLKRYFAKRSADVTAKLHPEVFAPRVSGKPE